MEFVKEIEVEGRKIGERHPCYIVAEAGVAHYGKIERAIKLIDLAVDAGADAVKFQVYKTEEFIDPSKDQQLFDNYKEKELPYSAFEVLQQYAKHRGITFFATPHEEKAMGFLISIGVPVLKIGSGEVGNWKFIEKAAMFGLPVFVSTGMYSWDDVNTVVDIFQRRENPNLVLLHCVTEYPTPPEHANLKRINELKERCKCLVGYSDHTDNRTFARIAISTGICLLEKHFCLFDEDDEDKRDESVSASSHWLEVYREHRDNLHILMGYKDETAWARKNLETGLRPE